MLTLKISIPIATCLFAANDISAVEIMRSKTAFHTVITTIRGVQAPRPNDGRTCRTSTQFIQMALGEVMLEHTSVQHC